MKRVDEQLTAQPFNADGGGIGEDEDEPVHEGDSCKLTIVRRRVNSNPSGPIMGNVTIQPLMQVQILPVSNLTCKLTA